MELNWNFQRGGGGGGGGDSNQKTFCGRGMDVFQNNTFLSNFVVHPVLFNAFIT